MREERCVGEGGEVCSLVCKINILCSCWKVAM